MPQRVTFTLQSKYLETDSWRVHLASESSVRVSREGTRLADTVPFLRIRVPYVEHNVAEWINGKRVERIHFSRVCRRCWYRTAQRNSMCPGCNAGAPVPTAFIEYVRSTVAQLAARDAALDEAIRRRLEQITAEPPPPRRPARPVKPRRVVTLCPPGEKCPVDFEVVFDGAYCE